MKFSIEKDQILEALQKVQSIVGQRTTLPILSNVLLEASSGKLTLATTDMEVSVRTSIEADGVTGVVQKKLPLLAMAAVISWLVVKLSVE